MAYENLVRSSWDTLYICVCVCVMHNFKLTKGDSEIQVRHFNLSESLHSVSNTFWQLHETHMSSWRSNVDGSETSCKDSHLTCPIRDGVDLHKRFVMNSDTNFRPCALITNAYSDQTVPSPDWAMTQVTVPMMSHLFFIWAAWHTTHHSRHTTHHCVTQRSDNGNW
jgi:hypothetical protein